MKPIRYSRLMFVVLAVLPLIFLSSCSSGSMTDKQNSLYMKAKESYLRGDFDTVLATLKVSDYSVSNGHQALLLAAKTYFMCYQPDKAESILLKLCNHYPRYTEAQIWLIRSYLAQTKFDKAERELERAMQFNNEDPRLLQLAASLHEAKKEYQKAFEYYARAADYGDEVGKSEIELAQLYFRFNQKDKAVIHLQRAKALISPENVLTRPLLNLEEKIKKDSAK